MYRLLSSKRQLFINNNNIEVGRSGDRCGVQNIQRVMHQPKKQGLVIEPDQPWESPTIQLLSNNVLYDQESKIFRLWYECHLRHWYEPCNMELESDYLLYAESQDGINWDKPSLGLYEVNGSKANNICLMAPGCGIMWAGVLEDPLDSNPKRRFKLLGHGTVGKHHGVTVYFSPDGIYWEPYAHNLVMYSRVDCGDSYTLMGCRDPKSGQFVASLRPVDWYLSYPDIPSYRYRKGDPQDSDGGDTYSSRRIGLSFSDDFMQWSNIQEVLDADLNDPPGTQIQQMTIFPYEDIYLGFPTIYYTDHMNDTQEIQLAVSNDLVNWQRVGNYQPFLPIGDEGPWHSQMIFALSATPICRGDQLYFYYNPHRTTHYALHENRYGAIGLATLRVDGFISMYSKGNGFLRTKPFTFNGSKLHVNADVQNGQLKVALVDELQRPYEGFLSHPITTDCKDHLIHWPEGNNLSALQDKPIRIVFHMNNTHLYSFWID